MGRAGVREGERELERGRESGRYGEIDSAGERE